jgi:hypothetical protein
MTEATPAPTTEGATPDKGTRGPRWWERLVPVAGLALALVAGAAFALPGLDDELELSTSRQPQPFVELSLSGRPANLCAGGEAPRVRFRVTSHLPKHRRIGYTISVTAAGGEMSREAATLRIGPGQAKSVRKQMVAPAAAPYTVTINLRHRPETVRVHCPGKPA